MDGALLAPPAAAEGEGIEDLIADLQPLVLAIKEHRLAAGLSFDDSTVVAHATNNFRKHRALLEKFYKEAYAEGRVQASSQTPKSNQACASADKEAPST